eukprot:m.193001 g.193001  ORF g.193001 m.193001 type:complete len:395 (+) comp14873_c0_seq2:485-1669(+)
MKLSLILVVAFASMASLVVADQLESPLPLQADLVLHYIALDPAVEVVDGKVATMHDLSPHEQNLMSEGNVVLSNTNPQSVMLQTKNDKLHRSVLAGVPFGNADRTILLVAKFSPGSFVKVGSQCGSTVSFAASASGALIIDNECAAAAINTNVDVTQGQSYILLVISDYEAQVFVNSSLVHTYESIHTAAFETGAVNIQGPGMELAELAVYKAALTDRQQYATMVHMAMVYNGGNQYPSDVAAVEPEPVSWATCSFGTNTATGDACSCSDFCTTCSISPAGELSCLRCVSSMFLLDADCVSECPSTHSEVSGTTGNVCVSDGEGTEQEDTGTTVAPSKSDGVSISLTMLVVGCVLFVVVVVVAVAALVSWRRARHENEQLQSNFASLERTTIHQ